MVGVSEVDYWPIPLQTDKRRLCLLLRVRDEHTEKK